MSALRLGDRTREPIRFVRMHLPFSEGLVRRHMATPRCATPERVVVSLTTIPDRLDHIRPTLHSLLDQSRRPDGIVLNLPWISLRQQREYHVPEYLERLSCVHVHRCDRDWGPATKFLPTLQTEKDPDTMIIVTDDDQIYPRNMVEDFVEHAKKLPKAALCARGHAIPAAMVHTERDTIYGTAITEPRRVEIIQGSAGFLIRPRLFSDAIFDYESGPPEAFFNDDVWLAGHFAGRGVERYVVPFRNCYSRIETWSAKRTLSLNRGENSDNRNTEVLYRYFAGRWTICD